MKRILKKTALAFIVALGSSVSTPLYAQYNDGYNDDYDNDRYYDGENYGSDRDVSYQTFYDELSPHGRWVQYPGHGYVWVPDAGPDFRPYSSNGKWVYTDNYEWMWVSEYDWGWAPFHYGRWDNDPHYGWYWVPGYEWAPAWVAWRDGGDYYGWAPIRPGINININFNLGSYSPPVDFWCFTPRRHIMSPRWYDYRMDPRRNVTIINHTTIIVNNFRYSNNYGFRSGPRRYDAERYTGSINPVRFRTSNAPGRSVFRNNEINVYRPRVSHNNNNTSIAPRRFDRYDANTANRSRTDNDFRRDRSNNTQVNTNSERRVFDRNTDQRNTPNNNDNRRMERRDNNTSTTNPGRMITPREQRPERTVDPGTSNGNNRRFERRGDVNPQPQRMERRQEPRVQQQPQPERRQEPRVQQEPRFERRQEPRVEQQQQPNHQFERRDNGNSGNGKGNRRF